MSASDVQPWSQVKAYGMTAGSKKYGSASELGLAGKRSAHTCDRFCGPALAGGDHDQEFHDTVIDLAAAALDDVNILVTHRNPNVYTGLAIAELPKIGTSRLGPQAFTDGFSQEGVGCPREDLYSPHLRIVMS